eukprot:1137844-Pelagomonas_calceolata.AAC.4
MQLAISDDCEGNGQERGAKYELLQSRDSQLIKPCLLYCQYQESNSCAPPPTIVYLHHPSRATSAPMAVACSTIQDHNACASVSPPPSTACQQARPSR